MKRQKNQTVTIFLFFLNKSNYLVPKKIKALRPLIKKSALDEPRNRHGKFIPHTEDHKNLLRNLELVRKSQPIFKPNMPGDNVKNKKSIDIETGNQPLQRSIDEYIRNIEDIQEKEEKIVTKNQTIEIEMISIDESKVKNFHTGGSFEDFQEIEKTLRNSIKTDQIHSILSSQNEAILSKKGNPIGKFF